MKQGKMWSMGPGGQEQFVPETLAAAVYMEAGGTQTLPEKLAELEGGVVGPPGPVGPVGPIGPVGPPGADGADGHTPTLAEIGAAADSHTHTPAAIGAAPAAHDHNSAYLTVPTLLGSGADLNAIQTAGLYYCPASATVATFLNCPTAAAMSLLVEKHAGVKQTVSEYYASSSAKVWRRNYYSGSWSAWYRVWDEAAQIPKANVVLPTPADIGAAPTSHSHTKANITDFPASLPASDVYAWAKAASKPAYSYSEVGAAAASHTHNYAGSGSAGGNANNSDRLSYAAGWGNSCITAWQNSTDIINGASDYASYLIFNHGDGSNYYHQMIKMPFWGSPLYQRMEGGVQGAYHKFYTDETLRHGTAAPSGGSANDIYIKHP